MKACPNCGAWISAPLTTPSVRATATLPADSYAAQIFASAPEQVVYPPAPLLQRAVAWLLDAVVVAVPGYVGIAGLIFGAAAVGGNSTWSMPAIVAGSAGLTWATWYYFTKDGRRRGAGVGKRAMGLMVVHLPTGSACTRAQSATRSLIWLVLGVFPVVGWLVEPVVAMVSKGGRRLGDRLADTQVIEAAQLSGRSAQPR